MIDGAIPLPGPGVVDQTSFAYKNLLGVEDDPSTSGITILAEQASTSGTTIDFTIPAGAKRVKVMFDGVSMSAAVTVGIQLGDADGIEATGYVAGVGTVSGTPAHNTSTTLFPVYLTSSTGIVMNGTVTLDLQEVSTFTWTLSGSLNGADGVFVSAGRKALSAELTTVRVMGGTFDAGAVSASWE